MLLFRATPLSFNHEKIDHCPLEGEGEIAREGEGKRGAS